MTSAPDVAVIGGGIAGCATAAFLAEAGLQVRLYERSEIASAASGRNSGVLQHPFDAVLAALYHATVAEDRTLALEVPPFQLPAQPAGLLYVGRSEEATRRLAAAWSTAWPDTRPAVVSGGELAQLEPALADDLVACRLEIGFPVAPAAATRAFAELARRRGAEVIVGGGISRPALAAGRVVGVERAGNVEPAGSVVVAAGPWTPSVVDPTGSWQPIRSSWGVVAGIRLADPPRHGLEAIDIDIEPVASTGPEAAHKANGADPTGSSSERTAVSDDLVDFSLAVAHGSSALGSTFLPDEPDPASWLPALRRVGSRYVPAVADAPLLGLRSCARPVSLDGRPLVGRAPWAEGLWIVAGHGPWGISTGPASARLVANAMMSADGRGAIPDALAVDRFGAPATVGAQRQESPSNR